MTTSHKAPDLLTEAETVMKELLKEAERLKIPNAYVSDIKELRKVIRIMRKARGGEHE